MLVRTEAFRGKPGTSAPLTEPWTLENFHSGWDPEASSITQSGGFVSQINDLNTSANRHYTQATGSAQPELNATGFQGGPALLGNGSTAWMVHGASFFFSQANAAIYFAVQAPADDANDRCVYMESWTGNSTPFAAIRGRFDGHDQTKLLVSVRDNAEASVEAASAHTVWDNNPHIVCLSKAGNIISFFVDSASSGSMDLSSLGTTSLDQSRILARQRGPTGSPDQFYNGALGPVYVFLAARTSGQAEPVESWMTAYPHT